MKPMLPVLTQTLPQGTDWKYEVKYDGYRAILTIDRQGKITLNSRTGRSLLETFPEIEEFLNGKIKELEPFVPLVLDGELVMLENAFKSSFSAMQSRGRMRSLQEILNKSRQAPARLLIFDLLQLKGRNFKKKDYLTRKEALAGLFRGTGFPLSPDPHNHQLLQMIPSFDSLQELWEKVVLYDGEGIVAKQTKSKWEDGQRTHLWQKYKNWKYVSCFITGYDKTNGYFTVAVYKENRVHPIGRLLYGMSPQEKDTLIQVIRKNIQQEDDQAIYIAPAIIIEVKYLEWYEEQLREPHFSRFLFDTKADDCTYEKLILHQKNLPADINVSHPDKILWEDPEITKMEYIEYLRTISPYLLPFLKDRLLTVIRYTHGIFGEAFFQKNKPPSAPEFIDTVHHDGIDYIVCNDLKTLLWLGNQLAIEFHIPFQTVNSNGPGEIVFDLDPPTRKELFLAVKAAKLIKDVLDQLELISFIKTSGSKGLQIYLPLQDNQYSYEDTRLFTSFIADYLVTADPDSFTTERLKKNRGNRLYIDYVQHGSGKTIIAPYSLRGNLLAAVAAPLNWEEVNEDLTIDRFRITTIIKRLNEIGDPFRTYFQAKEQQNFRPVLDFLKQQKH